jgi:hypothetical protein
MQSSKLLNLEKLFDTEMIVHQEAQVIEKTSTTKKFQQQHKEKTHSSRHTSLEQHKVASPVAMML